LPETKLLEPFDNLVHRGPCGFSTLRSGPAEAKV
jgi:hypothetical protein